MKRSITLGKKITTNYKFNAKYADKISQIRFNQGVDNDNAVFVLTDKEIKTLTAATGLRSTKKRLVIKRYKKLMTQIILTMVEEYRGR